MKDGLWGTTSFWLTTLKYAVSIILIANSGLSEGVELNVSLRIQLFGIGCCQIGDSSSQTVTSKDDTVIRVLIKSLFDNFIEVLLDEALVRVIESFMNLAFLTVFWIFTVVRFKDICIS